jgi:hypothetical protein
MKILLTAFVGAVPMLSPGIALAQNETMMNRGGWSGWMGGFGGMSGYGGILVPILLAVLVVGLLVWAVKQKGK